MRGATAPDQGSSGAEPCRTMVQAACMLTRVPELIAITTRYEELKRSLDEILCY
jgi:hypothetical protein